MAGRWYVHRNDQQHGPYQSDEIRQGLRDGRFDPFDLISREGSHVRVELMEIDEIFMHSQIEYMPSAGEVQLDQAAGGGGGGGGGGGFIGGAAAEVNPHHRQTYMPGLSGKPGQHPAGPIQIGQSPGGKKSSGSKRGKSESPKRFFLVESNGRITGPMAASEIQTAWSRGGLDKSLMVQKNNSSARVPVAKFVHLYSMAKLSGGQQGATQVTSPMLSKMIRVEVDRLVRLRKWMVPLLGLIVLGLAIAVAVMFFGSDRYKKSTKQRPTPVREITIEADDQIRPQPRSQSSQPSSIRRMLPPPRHKVSRLPTPKSASKAVKVEPPKTIYRPPPTRKSQTSAKAPVFRPSTVQRAPIIRPVPATIQRAPVQQAPVQQAPVQQALVQQALVQSSAGPESSGVGNVGGATYRKADLDACSMKCKIKFTARGEQIMVVFFKGAFEDQLKARKGPMTLSGRINQEPDGSRILYLQSVK